MKHQIKHHQIFKFIPDETCFSSDTYKHFLKWHVLLINSSYENNATKENMSQRTFLLFLLEKIIKNSTALCFISILLGLWPCAFICFLVFATHNKTLTLVFDIIITYFH